MFESIFIEDVAGKEYIEEIEDDNYWFCVQALYAIQIENKQKGLQTHEHRWLLVRAKSPEEAQLKVESESKEYRKPYLNFQMELVRWKLIKILDIDWVTDELDGDMNEIASNLYSKRIKSEWVWNKKYKS